jgi:hypothetical protein
MSSALLVSWPCIHATAIMKGGVNQVLIVLRSLQVMGSPIQHALHAPACAVLQGEAWSTWKQIAYKEELREEIMCRPQACSFGTIGLNI